MQQARQRARRRAPQAAPRALAGGRACRLGGTKRKLTSWKGTQTFQLATSVGRRSCRSLACTPPACPCASPHARPASATEALHLRLSEAPLLVPPGPDQASRSHARACAGVRLLLLLLLLQNTLPQEALCIDLRHVPLARVRPACPDQEGPAARARRTSSVISDAMNVDRKNGANSSWSRSMRWTAPARAARHAPAISATAKPFKELPLRRADATVHGRGESLGCRARSGHACMLRLIRRARGRWRWWAWLRPGSGGGATVSTQARCMTSVKHMQHGDGRSHPPCQSLSQRGPASGTRSAARGRRAQSPAACMVTVIAPTLA